MNNAMSSRRRFTVVLAASLGGLMLLAGCRSKEASVESLTAPIASPSPTPTPTVDPRITDLERIRPGVEAPDFSLTDQDGRTHRLADLRGKKRVVLVFYRGFF